ncbi:MAG: hypothetical protein HKN30_16360 [Sulfitobacter sp.]|nr:hypothetical protein [Sulfitobacter sp.]
MDVLADLKTFALSNELPDLAEQLDDTALVAMAEIASLDERMKRQLHGHDTHIGAYPGGLGAG